MLDKISDFCIRPENTIRETLECINKNGTGIALVVNEIGQLINTVTDGDVRRAILADIALNTTISELLEQKSNTIMHKPISASIDTPPSELLRIMQEHVLRQIPILDDNNIVVDLVTIDELLPGQKLPITAVIMAGGYGTRLRPLTEDLPKPMLPIGGKPLIELIVEHLREMGIHQVLISIHYLSEQIEKYLGDGKKFDVTIEYLLENEPLGTAGALGLIKKEIGTPILVINGDVLTKLNYRDMLSHHNNTQADLTVGVRQYNFNIPYGVVEVETSKVTGIREKPSYRFLVNAGVYLLNPAVIKLVPKSTFFNMTDLINQLLANGKKVVSFLITEYWLDIGQHDDYLQAQEDVENGRYG